MTDSTIPPGTLGVPAGPQGGAGDSEGLELAVRSQWSYARNRFIHHRLALIGLGGLIIFFGAGFLSQWVAPYPWHGFDPLHGYQAPSLAHPFGTDENGLDELSRVIKGIQTSAQIGVLVAALSSIIGIVIGAVAGYYGGWIDNFLMRFTDLFLTLPFIAILLTASKFLHTVSPMQITLLLVAFFWTGIARIVRGVFLSLREKEYVEAAKASGASDRRIMFRHIMPNTLGPIVVNGTLAVGTAILTEAALSFLALGIQAPLPSLGELINEGQDYSQIQWWLTLFPGLVLVAIVLCVNLVGDGLRDALDPAQRRMRA
jgi:peptide/nickel transport system permease protein